MTLTGDIVVFARWEKATYTVTFHVNIGKTPEVIRADGGTSFQSFTAPQVENYVLRGWYYDAEYEKEVTFPLVLHSDLEIWGVLDYVDPYKDYTKISDVMMLQNITDMNGKYVLTNDIDCENFELRPFGSETDPFKGEFIGNGYTISNFTIYNNSTINYFGLFIINEGTISNLRIENVKFTNALNASNLPRYIGLVCAYNKGTIKQISCDLETLFTDTTATGGEFYLGGLTGKNEGTISDCYVSGSISGNSTRGGYNICNNAKVRIGGIAGSNIGSIRNCFVTANITEQNGRGGTGEAYLSGISGQNSGTIEGCLFAGDLSSPNKGTMVFEAIANNTGEGTYTKCYRSYNVTASGGLAANEEYLNRKTFYTEMLGWSETYWDLNALNFGQGLYPKLHLQ